MKRALKAIVGLLLFFPLAPIAFAKMCWKFDEWPWEHWNE